MSHRPKPTVGINCFCLYCCLCWEGYDKGRDGLLGVLHQPPYCGERTTTVERGLPPTCVIFWAQLWGSLSSRMALAFGVPP